MSRRNPLILVLEPQSNLRSLLTERIEAAGQDVCAVGSPGDALQALCTTEFAAMVLPVAAERGEDLGLLTAARRARPALGIVATVLAGDVPAAVDALRHGADDVVTRPLRLDELAGALARALTRAGKRSARRTTAPAPPGASAAVLTGSSHTIRALSRSVAQAAAAGETVLILGECGAGQELVARAIHASSPRRDRPLVEIPCGALDEPGLERALASAADPRNAAMPGATIFLDEVDAVPPRLQARLALMLRARTEPAAPRSGIRWIAGSHRSLGRLVAQGAFRGDLLHLLSVLELTAPPLRTRREDLPQLAEQFLSVRTAARPILTPAGRDRLRLHDFPGNLPELSKILARALLLAGGGTIDVAHIELDQPASALAEDPVPAPGVPLKRWIADATARLEGDAIHAALQATQGNRSRAARMLGISRRSLHDKLTPQPRTPIM